MTVTHTYCNCCGKEGPVDTVQLRGWYGPRDDRETEGLYTELCQSCLERFKERIRELKILYSRWENSNDSTSSSKR